MKWTTTKTELIMDFYYNYTFRETNKNSVRYPKIGTFHNLYKKIFYPLYIY